MRFMTQSQCDINYGIAEADGAEARVDLRKKVRKIYEEQRSLWTKKYELQTLLKVARETGDRERERSLVEKLREIERTLDENDATRRRLSGT